MVNPSEASSRNARGPQARLLGAAAVLIAAVTVAACSSSGGSSGSTGSAGGGGGGASSPASSSKVTVSIADTRTIGVGTFSALEDLLSKQGIDVKFVQGQNFADDQRAVAQGDADFAVIGYTNIAQMAAAGTTNVKVVAGFAAGGNNLIVRAGSGINQWSDIDGKTIGIVPGSYAQVIFEVAAKEHGVDLSTVKLVTVAPVTNTVASAFKKNQIDGMVVWAPVTQDLVSQKIAADPTGIDIFNNKALGGKATSVLAVNTDFMTKNPDVYKKVVAGYAQTVTKLNSDLDTWAQYEAEATSVPISLVKASLSGNDDLTFHLDMTVSKTALLGSAKLGPQFGYTKQDESGKVMSYLQLDALAAATGKSTQQLLLSQ